jgi:hypothetical protein
MPESIDLQAIMQPDEVSTSEDEGSFKSVEDDG